MSNYFDPASLSLEDIISRTMGKSKDFFYDGDLKMEDHPNNFSYPGYVGYVQVNISSPLSDKGHVSYDIPYDSNGKFGRAVQH